MVTYTSKGIIISQFRILHKKGLFEKVIMLSVVSGLLFIVLCHFEVVQCPVVGGV